ncbi:MAG: hypothetical protein GY796_03795 [Chloroflexi bacterium]|nr:hypothetical protein [Chloroflexota bacterium]
MSRSKKHLRKRSRKKTQKKRKSSFGFDYGATAALRGAASWPLLECLIGAEWERPGEIFQLCVARRSPQGQVAAGVFLVDLGCLGVKNAYASLFSSKSEYEKELVTRLKRSQPMMRCDLDFAAKVVDEAVKYAASLGFKPNKDIKLANMVLGDTNPENCHVDIPLGKDGQPFFISGPYDNVDRVIRTLDRNVGQGNYHTLIQIPGPFDIDAGYDPDSTVDFE